MPLVSVILPCYNASEFVKFSIGSVLNQTYSNWELIVIDDASTDSTAKIITEIIASNNANFNFIRCKKNKGVSVARNLGLARATGKYICFLDSDDYWEPTKLDAQVSVMEATSATICYTKCNIINEKNQIIGERIYRDKVTYDDMRRRNYMTMSSVMISRQVILEQFKSIRHEDYLFWLENKSNNIVGVPIKLTNYRVHKHNMTKNKFKSIFWLWKLYYYVTGSPFLATINLFRNILSRFG